MKLTDKRYWNWRKLIVVLIISLLIAIVVFFKRFMTTDTADIERVGNEIIAMNDDFQKMNNRLPIGLNEMGTPFVGINETKAVVRGLFAHYKGIDKGRKTRFSRRFFR